MWSYNLHSETWSSEDTIGEVPNPRSGYSSCVAGDRIYLYGGEGETELYQDLFVFDTNSNQWSEITGIDLPPARKDACMACNFPVFAIYGGTTINGYDGDLYFINLAYNSVELLSSRDYTSNPGTRAHAKCWGYFTTDRDLEFILAIGETVGETPYSTIYTFSFNNKSWTLTGDTSSRSQAAAIKARNRLLFAGGERWGFDTLTEVFSFDLKDSTTTMIGNMPKAFFKGGSAYVKTSLYLHGGSDTSTKKFRPNVSSNDFLSLEMNEDCGSLGCDWPCSTGTYQVSPGKCEFCPKGTYNSEIGASQCLKCPKGTASNQQGNSSILQCYPCQDGYFASKEGSSRCFMCPSGYNCAIGNSEPKILISQDEGIKSSQPPSYTSNSRYSEKIIWQFQVSMLGVGLIVIVSYLFIREMKWILKLDFYKKLHNHFVDEPMYIQRTSIGGLFSMLFLVVVLLYIATTLITYSLNNIEESKALVPMVTLDEDFNEVMKR
jgi:hypothetical protein